MSDDRIDFSSLDPKRNATRFEARVQQMLAALQLRPMQRPLLSELVGWGRLAAAMAALLAVAAWLPSLLGEGPRHGSASGTNADRVELVSAWSQHGVVPSDEALYTALGDLHVH